MGSELAWQEGVVMLDEDDVGDARISVIDAFMRPLTFHMSSVVKESQKSSYNPSAGGMLRHNFGSRMMSAGCVAHTDWGLGRTQSAPLCLELPRLELPTRHFVPPRTLRRAVCCWVVACRCLNVVVYRNTTGYRLMSYSSSFANYCEAIDGLRLQ
jgi:hypothetical protein